MRWAWEADAACRGAAVDLWFLDSHENATEAKRVCTRRRNMGTAA